ncbi:ANKRD50 [Mytilus edulis]|uniref:ANKRD50 n=1 Tax=Mytilus edulis TaxID=6550 RepID=A0A8S3TLE4_MYTED|nr:ANKRD50 [Mytilus edulis]
MIQINSEHFDNFKSVAVALKITVDGLQDYVHSKLRSLHQSIYRKCSVGQCHDNCSRRYGHIFSQWCTTCQTWKKELHRLNRHRKHWENIKWNKLDTIDFPFSYEEACKVFVQDFSNRRQGLFEDLSALMSICRNLRHFNCVINDNIIGDILRTRNTYFAHNYALSLHAVEKAQCFNCLIVLFKIPEIACTQSSKTALNVLEEMKTSQNIPERILHKPNVQYTLAVIKDALNTTTNKKLEENTISNPFYDECVDNEHVRVKRFTNKQKTPTRNCTIKILRLTIFLTTLGIGTFIILYGLLSKDTIPVKGCLSVRFDEYWRSELDFDSYVEEKSNESIIERQWILQKIQAHSDTKRKGILVSADMGFGKSTIVSDIVCADPNSIWYSLRQQVLVYHMCRYDLILSSKPEVFVRNLAGAIVRTNPEIGNAILSDDMALDFLYGKCSMDPVACLEFSVLNKLRHSYTDRKHLIIIDAIDECETSGGTDLVDLLYKKISFFPDNFQFLITSRNIERLLHKFKELEHIDLQRYTQNNLQDIRLYLEKVEQLTNDEIDKFTTISGRNFLHVKLYLQYCKDMSVDDCDSIPGTLEKIYTENFQRVFGKHGDLFNEFICLFEVLCSLQNPIDENKLFEVAGLKSEKIRSKALRILGNELRHFIKISNGYISFQHKSISDFLTDSSRKHLNFYVDSQNGHKLFAKYLLNVLNASKTDNLVDIVYHVAMSREPEYETILFKYVRELKSNLNVILLNNTYLNQAAKTVNCYKTLKLFINLIIPNVYHQADQRYNGWIKKVMPEAAFIAAQYGNEESLLALLDHGSDIMYFHPDSSVPITNETERTSCQYELFCGYTMLHIAAQRGYIKIVRELLHRNITLLYQHNNMQTNAFHLAAEYGHVHILRIFLNINSSLADTHSLYLASKNGHTKVVILLINYVEDKCLPCFFDLSWRPAVQSFDQSEDGSLLFQLEYNLKYLQELNLWPNFESVRLITCDSPLNAAVKNGYIEIVKILIKNNSKSVNCSIYDGSIPLFTAVKYNQYEIFKILYDLSDLSHKCKGIMYDRSKLTAFEKEIIDFRKCPENAGMEHLLAIYDNLQLIKYHFKKGHKNWESRDKQGCTPVHHAFCHGSYTFVNFFIFEKRLNLNLLYRSTNGSSPFHLAASCQSFILHQYLKKMNERNLPVIPDVVDNQGHSILQYGLNKSISADDLVRIGKINKDDFVFSLYYVVISSRHNLLHKDKQNNNFLHYAAKAGNYVAFKLLYDLKLSERKMHLLLNQRNQNNRTPLEAAFDSLPRRKSFEAVRFPDNCSWTDVFFVNCKTNFSLLLSPHEYFIFVVFQYYHIQKSCSEINLVALLEISINKSRIYPILIMKVHADREVQSIIEKSFKIPFLLSKCNSPYIIELLLNTNKALRCDGKKSALHDIVHNDRNFQWTFRSLSFLDPLFKKYPAKYLDDCFDDQGYNLLHRSIMGAHSTTIQYLLDQEMNPWQQSKDNKTALEISIYKSPYNDNGIVPNYYTLGSKFQTVQYVSSKENQEIVYDNSRLIDFDNIAEFLLYINEIKYHQNRSHLCDLNKTEIGLIHIAAAKGLFRFLKKVKELYGTDYLRCEDRFGLTPIYIAHVYNQTKIVGWMRKLKLHLKRPEKRSEKVLLFNILDNYKSPGQYDWTCLLRYRHKYVGLIRNQILKCSFNSTNLPIHHSGMVKKYTYPVFRHLISTIENEITFLTLKTIVKVLHPRNKIGMDDLPSKLKLELHTVRVILCAHYMLQNRAYNFMRKFMLFRAGETEFVFSISFIDQGEN